MEKENVENWLKRLREYWLDKDIFNIMTLFKNTTFYQETPFLKPYTTFEEIKEEWRNIKEQDIKDIEFKILAIEDYTVIVEWYLEENKNVYTGIYELKFNNNLDCIYFKA